MKTRAMLLLTLVLVSASAIATAAGGQVRDEKSVPRISLADLKKAFDAKAVVIVDVRDAFSYATGHIPGAILVPLDALAKKVPELKAAKQPIVTYCAWPDEHTSARAALDLAALGVTNVKALLGGIQGWQQANYPMAKGASPGR